VIILEKLYLLLQILTVSSSDRHNFYAYFELIKVN